MKREAALGHTKPPASADAHAPIVESASQTICYLIILGRFEFGDDRKPSREISTGHVGLLGVFAARQRAVGGRTTRRHNCGGRRRIGGERDTAGIERIEVLKGPAAALLGRGEPGGTVNLVTKQARLGKMFGSFGLQVGSFDRLRSDGDINLAITQGLSARLIGYAERGDSFRDTDEEYRWGVLPSVGLAIGPDTRLTYDLEKTRVEVPFDRGIIVLNDDFQTVPRNRYLGEPGDGDHIARAEGHQLRLQHDFNNRWSVLLGASIRDTLLTGLSSDPGVGLSWRVRLGVRADLSAAPGGDRARA